MKKINTIFDNVYILEPTVFKDERGFFMESYSKRAFKKLDLHYNFVQDNHSYNKLKDTLEGCTINYILNLKRPL